MCGIVGFTSFREANYNKEQIIKDMCKAMAHRGPDGEGIAILNEVNFGHRRLSIVGLTTGAQPMYNYDKSLLITFNGEIYNYKELKTNLEKEGFKFKTDSDTEVILNLYSKHGIDCLKYLNGMFAFGLYDLNEKKLFLARDRMGEKPLFYQYHNGDIAFSSELKSILKHPFASRRISAAGLNKYLTYEYVPSPFTIFEDVWKVEPGEFIVVDENKLEKHFYWQHPCSEYLDGTAIGDERQAIEDIDSILRDSVRLRLQADVPVGVLLSGGLDSSLITAIASQISGQSKVKSFSIYFNEKSYDESPYIKQMVNNYGLDHSSLTVQSKDMLSIFDKLGSIMDEPMADASIVPTYYLTQMTSKQVKTVLGGDGSDEIFAGYPTYTANKLVQIYNIIPFELRNSLTNFICKAQGSVIPISNRNISLDFKLKQFFRGAGVASEIRFFKWMGGFLDSEKKSILSDNYKNQLVGHLTYEDVNRYLSRTNIQKELDRLLYLSQKLYLVDDILVKSDRAAMANSLEVRAPYLDHRLVEYTFSLPERFKLKRFTTKYILKKVAEKYLSNDIIYRPKKGFGIPITEWLRTDLKEPMLDLLGEGYLSKQGIFNHTPIKGLIEDHLNYKTNNRKLLWTLLSFQLWHREFMS